MAELEKAIKGLECCLNTGNFEECTKNCPYFTKEHGVWVCAENMQRDALSLLQAQEPKRMIGISEFDENISVGRCPSCDQTIVNNNKHPIRFCKYCGQAVKWDE